MEAIIRNMSSNDFGSISEMIKTELGYSSLDNKKTINRLEKIMRHEDYVTLVAEKEYEVIGFIGVFRGMAFNMEGDYAQIIALAVKAKYQGRGVGSRLIEEVEQILMNEGIDSVGVNSGLHRERAHEFYDSKGYKKKSFSFVKELM